MCFGVHVSSLALGWRILGLFVDFLVGGFWASLGSRGYVEVEAGVEGWWRSKSMAMRVYDFHSIGTLKMEVFTK